jgi:hypothetical protein
MGKERAGQGRVSDLLPLRRTLHHIFNPPAAPPQEPTSVARPVPTLLLPREVDPEVLRTIRQPGNIYRRPMKSGE